MKADHPTLVHRHSTPNGSPTAGEYATAVGRALLALALVVALATLLLATPLAPLLLGVAIVSLLVLVPFGAVAFVASLLAEGAY